MENFQIPTSEIVIPSQGLLYPENHPLKQGNFAFRAMTAREEDILFSKSLLRTGDVLDVLIESCCLIPNFRALDALSCDRNAMLVAIRISGFGSEYKTMATCPVCGESSIYDFNLSELPIKTLGEPPLEPNTNLFAFELPNMKWKILFRLLDGKDEKEIREEEIKEKARKDKLQESVSSKFGASIGNITRIEPEITGKLKRMIIKINNVEDKNKIAQMINIMPTLDTRAFREYIDFVEPRVEMTKVVTCSQCDYTLERDIPMTTDFFWPKR